MHAPNSSYKERALAAFATTAATPGVAKPDPIIVADKVTRRFGGLTAVNVNHVEIQRGSITALIGPNGAGKTTTVEILEGFRNRDSGEVKVLDFDPATKGSAGQSWRDRQCRFGERVQHQQGEIVRRTYPRGSCRKLARLGLGQCNHLARVVWGKRTVGNQDQW